MKKTSPFIYSREVPINTGGWGLKWKFSPFITLHYLSSFCFFQISVD